MAEILKPGSRGAPVEQLQTKLKQLGLSIDADGHYGPATRAAVEDLQAVFGYDVDGVAGDATQRLVEQQLGLGFQITSADAVRRGLEARGQKGEQGFAGAKLTRVLQTGMNGWDVRYLQRRLGALGYVVAVDGMFGAATERAVRALQQAFGYDLDGIVGEATDRLIYQQLGYGYRADASGTPRA